MKKIVLAALLASVLVFTVVSIGKSQSAEEMAKGQSAGIKYVKPYSDECQRGKGVIVIRGDEITHGQIQDWATAECKLRNPAVPNYTFGTLWTYSTDRITRKYKDGNKLILETDGYSTRKIIVDGYTATVCYGNSQQKLECSGGWNREQ